MAAAGTASAINRSNDKIFTESSPCLAEERLHARPAVILGGHAAEARLVDRDSALEALPSVGDSLRVESEVIEKRRSKSRREMGIFKSRAQVFNQDNDVVLEMTSNGLIAVRDPDAPIEG